MLLSAMVVGVSLNFLNSVHADAHTSKTPEYA